MDFYHLEPSDFESVEAGQLRVGDFLALLDPSTLDRYGAVRMDDIVSSFGIVVVTFYLPTGANIRSDTDPPTIIRVEWEGSTPHIEIELRLDEKKRVLRKR